MSGTTREQLRAQARLLGLPATGTKAELDARITASLAAGLRATGGGFTVGAWHGLPNYLCRWCTFATLHRRLIVGHVSDAHIKEVADATS